MASILEEILRRLENAERRLAQLEAAAGRADAPAAPPAPAKAPARLHEAPAPSAPVAVAAPAARPVPAPLEVPLPTPDITQRLSPVEPDTVAPQQSDGLIPFPDLSALDEKLEVKKAPAQRLNTVANIEEYPRICERIVQLWGTPECEGYLNSLIIDTRGNRKGFPPGVVEELLYLGRLARALVIMNVGGDLWSTYDQVGDRR